MVTLLLSSGADANTRDRNWVTPLHVCAANNSLECARLLLPFVNNIDVSDRSGASPLHHAAFNGHIDLIMLLLMHKVEQLSKANIILTNFAPFQAQANAFDKKDTRPIHYAAAVDCTAGIRMLITQGKADVNVRDKELMTPLMIAAANGALCAAQLLLDNGANFDAVDANGNSALHWAAVKSQDDIIDELIARGATIAATNHLEMTALHFAASTSEGTVARKSSRTLSPLG